MFFIAVIFYVTGFSSMMNFTGVAPLYKKTLFSKIIVIIFLCIAKPSTGSCAMYKNHLQQIVFGGSAYPLQSPYLISWPAFLYILIMFEK